LSGRLDNPKASHLYAVHEDGNAIFIAGEQGLLLRSTDAGQRFERIGLPYGGSFFALARTGRHAVVAGLGGNAFHSGDNGASWQRLAVPVPASITAVRAQDGKFFMTNQAGMVLTAKAGMGTALPLQIPHQGPLNDVLPQPDGAIVAVGMAGAMHLARPATNTSMATR